MSTSSFKPTLTPGKALQHLQNYKEATSALLIELESLSHILSRIKIDKIRDKEKDLQTFSDILLQSLDRYKRAIGVEEEA